MSSNLYGWPDHFQMKGSLELGSPQHEGLKFSIVIPTLNQSETLEHTLWSIINQDYKNFEIIIMDGGSTDSTPSIINKYRRWISYYTSSRDKGQSDAINKGFRMATGNIYAWINSDDYYLPNAFSTVKEAFASNDEIDVLLGAGDVITKNSDFLKHISPMLMKRDNVIKWIRGDWIMQQSCFWRERIWKEYGGVDESLQLLMDVDLWFRFAKTGKSMVVDQSLAAMRYYPETKTISLKEVVKEEMAYVLAKNGEYDEMKNLVRNLLDENKRLEQERQKLNNHVLIRIIKRAGISL